MERALARLDRLYAIGGGTGANRPAYSVAEDEAHALASEWMEEAGLLVERDPARNLYGRRGGRRPELGEIWTGSHLDSVPRGGRFDGALGVVAGLEAIDRLDRSDRSLCLVAFRDEEGWRFGGGCTGSRALTGRLAPGEIDAADRDGVTLRDVIGRALSRAGWLEPPRAFVEAHVEQGPVLDRLDAPLGVVSSIVGLARMSLVVTGSAGHAGTTPMDGRDDALVSASSLVLAIRDAATALPGAVATVGQLAVDPGAANVIPATVTLTVDARAPEEGTLAALVDAIAAAAGDAGAAVEMIRRTHPVRMDEQVQEVVRDALAGLGVDAPELHSGAGHDVGVLAEAGVPTGMLFIRSRNGGASHSPAEHTDAEDVAVCVDALTAVLGRLATAP